MPANNIVGLDVFCKFYVYCKKKEHTTNRGWI